MKSPLLLDGFYHILHSAFGAEYNLPSLDGKHGDEPLSYQVLLKSIPPIDGSSKLESNSHCRHGQALTAQMVVNRMAHLLHRLLTRPELVARWDLKSSLGALTVENLDILSEVVQVPHIKTYHNISNLSRRSVQNNSVEHYSCEACASESRESIRSLGSESGFDCNVSNGSTVEGERYDSCEVCVVVVG